MSDEEKVEAIRKRSEKRKQSGAVGGIQEWFEIDTLLRVLDDRAEALEQSRQIIDQAQMLADQGIRGAGAVNAYRLKAALDGEKVIEGE